MNKTMKQELLDAGETHCIASLADIQRAKKDRLNAGLRSIAEWCMARADGQHDTDTTLTMLEKKAAVLRGRVCAAGWAEIERRNAKLCGNCQHASQQFDVPPLGAHVHCNHPVIEIRDSPPYNSGWGTLRDARETCPHWVPRMNANCPSTGENENDNE